MLCAGRPRRDAWLCKGVHELSADNHDYVKLWCCACPVCMPHSCAIACVPGHCATGYDTPECVAEVQHWDRVRCPVCTTHWDMHIQCLLPYGMRGYGQYKWQYIPYSRMLRENRSQIVNASQSWRIRPICDGKSRALSVSRMPCMPVSLRFFTHTHKI